MSTPSVDDMLWDAFPATDATAPVVSQSTSQSVPHATSQTAITLNDIDLLIDFNSSSNPPTASSPAAPQTDTPIADFSSFTDLSSMNRNGNNNYWNNNSTLVDMNNNKNKISSSNSGSNSKIVNDSEEKQETRLQAPLPMLAAQPLNLGWEPVPVPLIGKVIGLSDSLVGESDISADISIDGSVTESQPPVVASIFQLKYETLCKISGDLEDLRNEYAEYMMERRLEMIERYRSKHPGMSAEQKQPVMSPAGILKSRLPPSSAVKEAMRDASPNRARDSSPKHTRDASPKHTRLLTDYVSHSHNDPPTKTMTSSRYPIHHHKSSDYLSPNFAGNETVDSVEKKTHYDRLHRYNYGLQPDLAEDILHNEKTQDLKRYQKETKSLRGYEKHMTIAMLSKVKKQKEAAKKEAEMVVKQRLVDLERRRQLDLNEMKKGNRHHGQR